MENNDNVSKQENKYLVIILLFLVFTITISAQSELCISDLKIELDTLKTIPALSAQSIKINKEFSNKIYKEHFKLVPSKVNIYNIPYSITGNYPNYRRLALNTGALYGAGFVALGVLQLLPENATSWNKKKITSVPPFRRWWSNVRKGPVRDNDNFMFNYVLHSYGGAAYYMAARSLGFNLFYSFLYTAGISTFFWEYGIEAFMEIPSIQDLIITPLAGVLLGEGFYILKRHIVANDYKLLGSSILGNVVAYIIDPVNEVIGIFAGNSCRKKHKSLDNSLACTPWYNKSKDGNTFGFTLSYSF